MRHLTPEELIDLAEGTRAAASAPHLASCAVCRAQIDELRATFTTAAAVDVPEPSPLFWNRLSARVRTATADDSSPVRGAASWLWKPAWIGAAVAIAALAVVVVVRSGVTPVAPDGQRAQASLAAESPSPDQLGAADDASLALVADLTRDLDWDGVREAGLVGRGSAERAVTHLSDDELRELRRLLADAIGAS